MSKKRRRKKGRFLIRTGILLLAAAALMSAYNLLDAYMAGRTAHETAAHLENLLMQPISLPAASPAGTAVNISVTIPLEENTEGTETLYYAQADVSAPLYTEMEIPDYQLNPNMEMPTLRHEGQEYIGLLEIPALELKLPIISEWSYPRLKKSPCRYVGSPYTNDLVIAAHNYSSHFGNLNKLYEGASVVFTDIDGNVFTYRVALKETLGPYDVEYMKNSGWDLSLFTCTPGGKYRVTIRCTLCRPHTISFDRHGRDEYPV